MSKALGFDLGSAYTAMCIQNETNIVAIPSVVTIDKKSDRLIASGNEAKKMIGRAPDSLNVIKPLKNGLISDADATSLLMSSLLEKAEASSVFKRTEIIVTLPFGTENEENARERAIMAAGISTFDFVYTPIAIALGAGMPIDLPNGRMVVDVGAGHTDASVISHGDVIVSSTINTAGDAMTDAIRAYVADEHGIEIGELTAEALKTKLGTLNPSAPIKSVKICGKVRADKNSKHGDKITASALITSQELVPVLTPYADRIVENIVEALKNTPNEISADISEFGLILSGGGAMLNGLAKYLENALRIKVSMTKRPSLDAICGVLRIVEGGRAFAKFTR